MTTFFLDLWHDLREKRLWPVAAGLAVAILAVPVVLMKSSSSSMPVASQPAAPKSARLPAVNLDQTSVAGSHLNVFKEKNPFKGLADNVSSGAGVAGSGTTFGSGTSAGSSAGSSAASSGKSGTAAGSSSGGSSSAGSSSGGSSSGGSGGSSSGGSGGEHFYIFTADVRFGQLGHVHTYKGIKQLDLLPPGSKNPTVSFYGVQGGGETAVFFNLNDLGAAGEGKCVAKCRFVELKKGQEEAFFSGSTQYTLKVLDIHTVEVSKDQALGKASSTPGNAKISAATAKKRVARTLLTVPGIAVRR